MTPALVAFAAVLALQLALDRKKRAMRRWFGNYALYMKVNVAILAAAAVTLERRLVGLERSLVYAGFLTASLVNVVWAGLIGRAARRSKSGATGEEPPRQRRAPSGPGTQG